MFGDDFVVEAYSDYLYLRIDPQHVAMFRFLLEAYDNLAYFTVLDRNECLLKVIFSPDARRSAQKALDEIGRSVPIFPLIVGEQRLRAAPAAI